MHPHPTQIGRLTVVGAAAPAPSGHRQVLCRCDCGNECVVRVSHLRTGAIRSCGCFNQEERAKRKLRHGHERGKSASPSLRRYRAMKSRCLNPNRPDYERYGGRGIGICARWLGPEGFQNFLVDMGEAPAGKTLDRIDNDGNYEPANCRWATPAEQANNRRPRSR